MKKAFFNGTILLVIIALIGAFVFAINSPLLSLAPVSVACSDTDGGINLTLAGTTCDTTGCATDYCASSSKLAEYSCSMNRKTLSTHLCALGCINERCRLEGTRYNLYTASAKLYLNDSINNIRQAVTGTIFPTVLSTGSFNNGTAFYVPIIAIGSPKIIFSKSTNKDPKIGIYDSKNYLYNVSIIFSNPVNFTDSSSINQNIILLNRNFIVDNETNGTRLVLRDDKKYILEDNKPIKFKQINPINPTETTMIGTLVKIYGGLQGTLKIEIQVFPSDEQTITEGSYLIDPLFGTFKIDFNGVSAPESSAQRENLAINSIGNDKITLTMKDHRGLEQTINWLKSDGMGNSILADSNGNRINTIERVPVSISDYAIISNGSRGYILKVLNITNATVGYANDAVVFQDLFSNQLYDLNISSEGNGILSIENSNYLVAYSNSDLMVRHSTSLQGNVVIYPPIESSKGAKVEFYEPLTISLNNISSFKIFNGNSYVSIPVIISGTNFIVGNQTVTPNSSAISNSGKLNYEFTYYAPLTTKVFLRDILGNRISKPSIIIFEKNGYLSNYEALIAKTEGMGSSADKVGIQDIEMTWGNNRVFKNLQLISNPSFYKSMDMWGSIIILNKSNTDQFNANINYNQEQLWNSIYVSEIV